MRRAFSAAPGALAANEAIVAAARDPDGFAHRAVRDRRAGIGAVGRRRHPNPPLTRRLACARRCPGAADCVGGHGTPSSARAPSTAPQVPRGHHARVGEDVERRLRAWTGRADEARSSREEPATVRLGVGACPRRHRARPQPASRAPRAAANSPQAGFVVTVNARRQENGAARGRKTPDAGGRRQAHTVSAQTRSHQGALRRLASPFTCPTNSPHALPRKPRVSPLPPRSWQRTCWPTTS